MNLDRAAHVADIVCPELDGQTPNHRLLNSRRLDVVVGLMYELPTLTPSSVEVGQILCISHQTVMAHWKRWQAKPWRERYGWLVVAEGRAA
jgi:hypothetical protein